MPIADRLIGSIHPALNTDPVPLDIIGLAVSVATAIEVTAESCTVYQESAAPLVFSLAAYTLSQLVAALPGSVGASLLASDWGSVGAVALIPDQVTLLAGGVGHLAVATSSLWRVVRPIGAQLDALGAVVAVLVAQTDIRQAGGGWLDLWGMVWAIPRVADEDDAAYRQRIIYTLTLPRNNNRALETIIRKALGRSAQVTDGGLGTQALWNDNSTWGPTNSADIWGPQQYGVFVVTLDAEYAEDTNALIALIQQYKAAGTTFALNTRYAPEAVLTYGDVTASTG